MYDNLFSHNVTQVFTMPFISGPKYVVYYQERLFVKYDQISIRHVVHYAQNTICRLRRPRFARQIRSHFALQIQRKIQIYLIKTSPKTPLTDLYQICSYLYLNGDFVSFSSKTPQISHLDPALLLRIKLRTWQIARSALFCYSHFFSKNARWNIYS